MEALLASPVISAIISIIVAYIAFKVAFFTIKKVAFNVISGVLTYWICTSILEIPMDIGFGVWALTALFGPIPMIIAALWYGLF